MAHASPPKPSSTPSEGVPPDLTESRVATQPQIMTEDEATDNQAAHSPKPKRRKHPIQALRSLARTILIKH